MMRIVLAVVATAAIASPAQATTDAGTTPIADPTIAAATNAELFAPFTEMQFGNGRTMPFSVTRDPGLTSSGFVPSDLTSGGPLAGVPEPRVWMMLIAGFGLVGLVTRRRKVAVSA
jgi:hypothetical protein